MKEFWIIAICYVILKDHSADPFQNEDLVFPENFKFGTGSASYQIEGAWNVSDKSESILDRWTHFNSEAIKDRSNGDIAADFHHKYREDVQLIKSTGVDMFRFSISWSRILPNGMANEISKDGLQFYKNLTAELVANGIEPVVTLYHWDHPQILEEYGGWTNELMVDWFVSYARIMFQELGDSVKIWSTINQPNLFCSFGYADGVRPPGKMLNGNAKYICVHNMLKAHAKTYHLYNESFRATQQGEIGILPLCEGYMPLNSSDTESAEVAFQFECGWIAHPIYHGDYPEIMKTRIATISKAQGYEKSRLPEFSKEWVDRIRGTADYFGLNHYSTKLVTPDPDAALGIYNSDNGLILSVDPNWTETCFTELQVVPSGFGNVLRQIKNKYGNPPVRIMENGFCDQSELNDYNRTKFYHDYLAELLKAMHHDGCIIKSYTFWSFLDDFEWELGYTLKFGTFNVDFSDPERTRRPKLSTSWWKNVSESRQLQPVPDPSNSGKTF